jgi:hypothetical protein
MSLFEGLMTEKRVGGVRGAEEDMVKEGARRH